MALEGRHGPLTMRPGVDRRDRSARGARRVGVRGIVFPATGATFAAQTGLTLDSLYTFQEASGNLLDKAGSTDLGVNGAPTFAQTLLGRQGIYYDAADERHAAQVHDPGAASMLAFAVCSFVAVTGTGGIFGGYDAADALDGWLAYRNINTVEFHIRSSAAGGSKSVAATTTLTTGQLYLVSLQVDRAANTGRGRITPRGGVGEGVSVDITGLGTLSSGGNHLSGFGSTPLLGPGVSVYYGGIKLGAGAEGATRLQTLHRSLGWEP